jgi:hypothetical protein
LHNGQDFQLLKLPFEARLETRQIAKTPELGIGAKIHDREHDDAIVKDLGSRLPEPLQAKPALRGRDTAKAVERTLLKRAELRFRDRPAVGVGTLVPLALLLAGGNLPMLSAVLSRLLGSQAALRDRPPAAIRELRLVARFQRGRQDVRLRLRR